MKKYKGKSLSNSISSIGSMLLFLLFAGCMLMIIAVAAGSYSRISTNYGKTFGVSASLRYISNKIKSSDEVILKNNALVLQNSGVTDIIYIDGSKLYESCIPFEEDPEIKGGEKIFELDSFEIGEENGLYRITVSYGSEKESALVGK